MAITVDGVVIEVIQAKWTQAEVERMYTGVTDDTTVLPIGRGEFMRSVDRAILASTEDQLASFEAILARCSQQSSTKGELVAKLVDAITRMRRDAQKVKDTTP